ncbi:DUF3103 family protein [Fulvivirga ligni]|uniref:DUF3103 family protein n=1 Tax=Fulvivirga ligni TaxID=2904246 RepID=UPI001F43A89C|nr:DUF3103 family protein [Fulvivirga ligni]UII22010.1 DUF3103 domain-containing protein [Fulvivirga ligni]
MIKKTLAAMAMASAVLLASCNDSQVKPSEKSDNSDLDQMALDMTSFLKEGNNLEATTALLKTQPVGVKLSEVISKVTPKSSEVGARLNESANFYDEQLKGEAPEEVAIPELWLHEPNGVAVNAENVLVAYPPAGDEAEWTKVRAYTLQGEVVYLDAKQEPNVPVIVLEKHGFEAFKVEVSFMNKKLQEAGLQENLPQIDKSARTAANGAETTILDKIRLNDDQEPWISGAAEIYAVTSGIRNADKDAEVAVIPMYYLDKEDKDYYPNQIMLFWDDYAYQAANIQLFEKDDNHNYQDLVSILISEISKLAGTISGQPWITAVGTIGSAIVEALPDSFWTNDDDYVDSFYTIEKNKTYTNYYGAGGNAKVNLRPYFIPAN